MSTTTNPGDVTVGVPDGTRSIHDTLSEGRYQLLLGLSPEMNQVIEELALRYGGNKADVINQAVGLFKFFSDSARAGKRVGVASREQELETEITEL